MPGSFVGFKRVHEAQRLLSGRARPHFDPDGVLNPAEELDMGSVERPRALAFDPREVRGQVVPAGAARDLGAFGADS